MSIHCRKRMSRGFWFSVLSNSAIRMGDNLATEMEEHYKTFVVSHFALLIVEEEQAYLFPSRLKKTLL